jgi:predicted nucleotidyltransferase
MDQRKTIIDKVKTYRELVDSDFPLKIDQYWLFGSFAKGNPNEDSDIDVALVVDKFDDNYNFFETEPILWKLSEKVDYRIEPHLIAKNTDFSGFLTEINKTGIRIT